jgi:hypothetical protein
MGKKKKDKPTRNDVNKAINYIGQKLQYLEDYCVGNEKLFDLYLEFEGKKEAFIEHIKEKSKEVEEAEKKESVENEDKQ